MGSPIYRAVSGAKPEIRWVLTRNSLGVNSGPRISRESLRESAFENQSRVLPSRISSTVFLRDFDRQSCLRESVRESVESRAPKRGLRSELIRSAFHDNSILAFHDKLYSQRAKFYARLNLIAFLNHFFKSLF